ncbi:MAG TPA: hypothetical protein VMU34_17510 [Mycobacterium sp.]|nr:hypothetical protein [Mycobacterium sp.]
MTTHNTTHAKLTTIAYFPENFFLENLAVRGDGSILITVVKHKQLWYVPTPGADLPVDPVLVHTFDSAAMGIVEADPDVFYVCTFGPASLERVDLRDWSPGAPATVSRVFTFDPSAVLNGACLIAPRIMLVADSVAGQIWRVDLAADGLTATARVWLAHDSMAFDLDNPLNPQPGVNGVRYDSTTDFLYYTSTTRRLFMRVAVDPATHEPASEPEFVAGGTMADDFCIDESAGVAYVTTHRENTIDRVPLRPGQRGHERDIVAGQPFTAQLVGPSSAAWGRGPHDYGRVAYVTTDGGTTAPPPDGIVRPAQLLRIQLAVD